MQKDVSRIKHEIDATGKVFGRLASHVAKLLQGKHKPQFRAHLDLGDFVNIKNIRKLTFSGKKLAENVKYRFSGYPGGLKEMPLAKLWSEKPHEVFRKAVSAMLPKNKLSRKFIKRLTFSNNNHES